VSFAFAGGGRMLVTGFLLFSALGKDPVEAFYLFFIKPLSTTYGFGELLLKQRLCCSADWSGAGLSGQRLEHRRRGPAHHGAIAAAASRSGSARQRFQFAMPLMLLAGILGGMAWAAIPAFLRTRFQHQRNSGHADAGVYRPASAFLAGARTVARSAGTELPAVARFW